LEKKGALQIMSRFWIGGCSRNRSAFAVLFVQDDYWKQSLLTILLKVRKSKVLSTHKTKRVLVKLRGYLSQVWFNSRSYW